MLPDRGKQGLIQPYSESQPAWLPGRLDQSASSSTRKIPSAAQKAKPSKSDLYHRKIEMKRRDTVADFRAEYERCRATISRKNPLEMTRDEQLHIAELRLRIQVKIGNFKQVDAPYINELIEDLNQMRNGLTKHSDYIDRSTFLQRKRQRNLQSVIRYQTRKKAEMYGVVVNAPPRGPLQDNPPPMLARKRKRGADSNRRVRERKREEERARQAEPIKVSELDGPKDLFPNGWGKKGHRF